MLVSAVIKGSFAKKWNSEAHLQSDAYERDGRAERVHARVWVGLGVLGRIEKAHRKVVQVCEHFQLRWE